MSERPTKPWAPEVRGAHTAALDGSLAVGGRDHPPLGNPPADQLRVPMVLLHAALEGAAGDKVLVAPVRASRYLIAGTARADEWNEEQLRAVAEAHAERQEAIAARLRADGLMVPGGASRGPATTFPWD